MLARFPPCSYHMWMCSHLTIRVRLLVSISCVNETRGTVMFVLELHVQTGSLAERISSSWKEIARIGIQTELILRLRLAVSWILTRQMSHLSHTLLKNASNCYVGNPFTAPVLGHLEHVGSSAVHLARLLHFVMSSREMKRKKKTNIVTVYMQGGVNLL